jgi:catechol 2,3-dioxygenase-like lactoylglutathione lyase family enzyme
MFKPKAAFSGFSVDNMDKAKKFYTTILDLKVRDDVGGSKLDLPGGTECWMYAKNDHQPATYTILNFVVDDVDEAVDELISRGVSFEKYDVEFQDDKGIMHGKAHKMGPNIAWFKDPAGNILSVLEPD